MAVKLLRRFSAFVVDSKVNLESGLLMRCRKVNLGWNEICLKKTFVYQRNSAGIEQKISQFSDKKTLVNAKNATITGDFNSK